MMTLNKLRDSRFDFLVTGIMSLVILALTLSPKVQTHLISGAYADKLDHVFAFGVLVLPIGLLRRNLLWKVAIYSLVLGAVVELLQPLTGRHGDIADFLADLMGIGLAVLIILIYHAIYKPRHG